MVLPNPGRPGQRSAPLAAAALAAAAVGILASCEGPADPMTDARCREALRGPEAADAFDWLKTPAAVPKQLGGMTVEEALALAHKLQARGARRLTAVGDEPGRPATDPPAPRPFGLVVELPDEPAKRLAVFQIYAQQVRARGESPLADSGQKYLFIPWAHEPT